MMAKARKKTSFVPTVVFGTVVVGVIPACVVSSCGGSTVSPSSDAQSDVTADGVAATCFGPNPTCPPCCGVAAVAYMAFDSGDANDAAADGPTDSPADTTQPDVILGVAAVGFCAFCDGGDEGGG
jgi:hypothetical protein